MPATLSSTDRDVLQALVKHGERWEAERCLARRGWSPTDISDFLEPVSGSPFVRRQRTAAFKPIAFISMFLATPVGLAIALWLLATGLSLEQALAATLLVFLLLGPTAAKRLQPSQGSRAEETYR